MSSPTSRFVKICSLVCGFSLGYATMATAAELVLQKVPPLTVEQAPSYPENLARYHFGAQVEAAPQSNPATSLQLSSKSEDHNTAEAALLLDDPTIGYALSNGTTTLLVSLPKIENIDSISFLNNGAKGEVIISTSNAKLPADSPQWRQVSQQELTPDTVKAKVGPSEAKYVKLTFNVTEPGRIAAFGVYSSPTVASFTMPRARKPAVKAESETLALISYNLTDVHSKARALYVSSGDDLKQANSMIDNQPSTGYTFATSDGTPAAVIDLGKETSLRRISAIYSPQQGTVDFYVLQSLPGGSAENAVEMSATGETNGKAKAAQQSKSAPQTLRVGDSDLASFQPVGSIVDGNGRAAIDFPETTGRYIMIKWTPASQPETPFSVAEVAAFGSGKPESLLAANTIAAPPDEERVISDGKTLADGKTLVEGKDLGGGKEIPAEGPAEDVPAEGPPPPLPPPPPFTFVPLIVPTSP